jgi:hypothetical protein
MMAGKTDPARHALELLLPVPAQAERERALGAAFAFLAELAGDGADLADGECSPYHATRVANAQEPAGK